MKEKESHRVSLSRSLGPAVIVACVVLGPGSILANSKVGWQFGYAMIWVLVLASGLMMAMTMLSARLGVHLQGTLCDELARRAGRPLALVTGATLFLVASCFQFSNNLGVLYALEPWLGPEDAQRQAWWPIAVLVFINGGIIAALCGVRRLYLPIERLMKLLVATMVIGFAANLLLAQPSPAEILRGLWPRLPKAAAEVEVGSRLLAVLGMIGTTFSVGGAFYQSYLVRQKGWKSSDLRQGMADSAVGIAMLGLISLMIMVTAASVLHGNPDVVELNSAADVARQLRPLFGPLAMGLFCLGIFAGAFSSFLVNAMIGGAALSDGMGMGGGMDQWAPKICTIAALLLGMVVALAIKSLRFDTASLIIFAQALTVLGNPLLAGAMLWLATRPDLRAKKAVPLWNLVLAAAGFVVVLLVSLRLALIVYQKLIA